MNACCPPYLCSSVRSVRHLLSSPTGIKFERVRVDKFENTVTRGFTKHGRSRATARSPPKEVF